MQRGRARGVDSHRAGLFVGGISPRGDVGVRGGPTIVGLSGPPVVGLGGPGVNRCGVPAIVGWEIVIVECGVLRDRKGVGGGCIGDGSGLGSGDGCFA